VTVHGTSTGDGDRNREHDLDGDRKVRAMRRRRWLVAILAAVALVAGGCGGGGDRPALIVSAAASLKQAFTRYGQQFAPAAVRFSFAGSDELAAQIEQGVDPDVFASANTTLPALLYRKGLVEKPLVFAANRLVLAVPSGSRIVRLAEVERPGVTLAVGAPTVPIGIYTRTLLNRLGAARRQAVLRNVKDSEPDVTGIVGKLTEGAVEAGFLYATDVAATDGRLRAIQLPARLQPQVAYGVAIAIGAEHPAQARAFLAGLLHGAGRRALLASGFLQPAAG
jgi:molybdate transport system substrate-binding protein